MNVRECGDSEPYLSASIPRPESRRVSAAGQRPTAPPAGAPWRDVSRSRATAERRDKALTSDVAAPPRGRALPSVSASGAVAGLILLLGLAVQPAAADILGIPLARQPFIKVCPDGTIVGSFGPNLTGKPTETIGASIYDPRTGTTTFIRRDAPDFEERLAANPCVRKPIGGNRDR